MSAAPLLEVRDASVRFGGVHALRGAELSVSTGSLCGLIGPNGSGKSTLVNVISRLTKLTGGALLMDGDEIDSLSADRARAAGIARTFQTVRLLPSMDVLANVMLGGATHFAQRSVAVNWLWPPRRANANRTARQAALVALERVGMAAHAHARPQALPYGQQRRVEIARALASRPRLLLLDEPTAGMSHHEREEVGDLLMELRREGLTQVLVEHDLAMIHRVCDHAHALNFGRVIASGSTQEVAADPGVREAYLGHGSSGERAQDSERAQESGPPESPAKVSQ